MTDHFYCVVYGQPIGQGRISCYGKGRAVHSNHKTLDPWRLLVARTAIEHNPPILTDRVQVNAAFYFARPKSHLLKSGAVKPDAPTFPSRPDLDHLQRAIGDALTGVCYLDDAQIVTWRASKDYVGPAEAMQEPGVVIEVMPGRER